MRVVRTALLGLFIVMSPFSVDCLACVVVETESSAWERVIETIEMIRNDAGAASREAADWWCDPLDILRDPPEGLEHEAEEMEAFLTSFAKTSTDDWLVDRIGFSLTQCVEEAWTPLFIELLEHPSIQIRWRAVQHFAFVDEQEVVPALEALWDDSLPPWIRTDLADALLENGSERHAEDCVGLVDADDLDLARAALRTLEAMRPAGSMEAVRRLARQADSPLRVQAVAALAAWPDDEESMRLLVELSRSEVGTMQNAALTALSEFSRSEAVNRLVEVVSDPGGPARRRLDALGAVLETDHPALIRVLWEILDEPTTDQTILLHKAAHDGLTRLGVALPLPTALTGELTTSVLISCGYSVAVGRTIRKPPDGNSVRCWAAPHIEGDPEDYERLEVGEPVELTDHFQTGDDHWVLVDDDECWIPFDQLDDSIEGWGVDSDWPYRHEFDVWLAEIDSPLGQALLAAGMIRLFDVGDKVAAIEFTIDPGDHDAVGRLAELYLDDESEISFCVWAALDELKGKFAPDTKLGDKVRRALGE